ncbi:MAG TPA: YjjG family noncanonical pyrimidine nucleotidase [Catalimonadaceae bacterium]|nr:YjjG family noncanonical pyrimidine nucleotidase [Catalimonadaceae bacterium]
MIPAGIRHLFFDLDHTLWDYDRNAVETLVELYDEFSLSAFGLQPLPDFLTAFRMANVKVWDLFEETVMNQHELRHKRLELVFQEFGLPPVPIDGFNEAYYTQCSMGKHLIEGALETVKSLHGRFEMHIITNGFEDIQYLKLENTGLAPYFKTVTTSEKARSKKPEAAYFDFALRSAQAGKSESLVIGDGLRTDVAGARGYGLPVIWFNPDKMEKPHPDVMEIQKLIELCPCF